MLRSSHLKILKSTPLSHIEETVTVAQVWSISYSDAWNEKYQAVQGLANFLFVNLRFSKYECLIIINLKEFNTLQFHFQSLEKIDKKNC